MELLDLGWYGGMLLAVILAEACDGERTAFRMGRLWGVEHFSTVADT